MPTLLAALTSSSPLVRRLTGTMKVIGMLGGMSWESTVYYYQQLNRGVRERLDGLHSAHSITYTVDFSTIERMQAAGAWPMSVTAPGTPPFSIRVSG